MAQIEDVNFSVVMDYSQANEIDIYIEWDVSDTFPQEKVEQLIEYMNRNLVLLFGFFKDKFRLYLEYNEVLLSFSVKMRFEFDDIRFSIKFPDKDNGDTGAEYLARCIMNDLLTGNETIEKLLEYLQDDDSKSVEEIVLQ